MVTPPLAKALALEEGNLIDYSDRHREQSVTIH